MSITSYMTRAWTYRPAAGFQGKFAASDPTILLDGDILRMFYTDGTSDGTTTRPIIAQAISVDGVTWTQIGGNAGTGIVIEYPDAARANVEAACVYKVGDLYVMLYSGYADGNLPLGQFPAQLYAATSTDGTTFFDASPDPVLAPTAGWFDNDAVFSPTVIAYESGYAMLYAGHNYNDGTLTGANFGVTLLGAFSVDGLAWNKLPTPVLEADPALAWMADGTAEPALVRGADGNFYLFFTALAGESRSIGLAVAADPFGPWTIAPDPIVTAASAGLPPDGGVVAPHAELIDGVLRLWFTRIGADGYFSIGYAESDWDGGATTAPTEAIRIGSTLDDQIFGDEATDLVLGYDGNDLVATSGGDDLIDTGTGQDEIWAGTGDDTVVSGSGDDVIFLEDGNDIADAGDGDDIVSGEGGNDSIQAGSGQDVVDGADGDDTIDGGDGDDVLFGDAGADTIDGGLGADLIDGGSGNDTLHGGAGTDVLSAGEDDSPAMQNLLTGDAGEDVLVGFAGTDTLDGGDDDDVLYAGAGNDNLHGGAGADALNGEDGNDRLAGGAGADVLAGGAGVDTADYAASTGVTVALDGSEDGTGDAAGDYLDSIENLTGSATGGDRLIGNAGANRLEGQGGADMLDGKAGADTLVGGAGDDVFILDNIGDVVIELTAGGTDTIRTTLANYTLAAQPNVENLAFYGTGGFIGTGNAAANRITGGAGADTLIGGLGADILSGGAGRDVFRYALPTEGGDTLVSFSPVDDTIQVSASGFGGGLAPGALPSNRLVLGATANRTFGQFLYDRPTGRLLWDADGTGTRAPTVIASMGSTPGPLLTMSDIVVI